jgi:amino acid adenylation domain-containing protein
MTDTIDSKKRTAAGLRPEERDFWLDKLAGEPVKSRLPYDRQPAGNIDIGTPPPDSVPVPFSRETAAGLLKLSNRSDVRLYIIFVSALMVMIKKYTGSSDIVIGAPIYKQEVEGELINTVLVLRQEVRDDMTFKEFLMQVSQTVFEANTHQNYPMETLMYKLNIPFPGKADFPLFDISVLLETIHYKEYLHHVNHNLRFSFDRTGTSVKGNLEYNPLLYEKKTARRMAGHYTFLLEGALAGLEEKIGSLALLSEDEKQVILHKFNGIETEYPAGKLLHQLVEEQVERAPDRIAVVGMQDVEAIHESPLQSAGLPLQSAGLPLQRSGSSLQSNLQLSYRVLNERSNRLAGVLRSKGAAVNTIVGLLMEPSVEMIVSILAVLKAGASYLPIDSELPLKRILYMLEDCRAPLLVSDSEALKKHPFTSLQSLYSGEAEPLLTAPRAQIDDLDRLPFTDRSLVDYEAYGSYMGHAMIKNTYITLMATRGCPYKCAYCHKIWPRKHVFRSAGNIFQEVQFFYRMGVRRFVIIDDVFNLNMENSSRFFRLIIEKGLDIRLFFPNGMRGDLLTEEYIDLMVEAGTVNIALALETASPRLQKMLQKNLDLETFKKNVRYLCETHPHVILEFYIMHGFPTETEEEAIKTLDFLKDLKWVDFPYIFTLKIYSNTEMEKMALAHGISRESIVRSENMGFTDLTETLPFSRDFTLKYRADYLNNYILLEERLLHLLPLQTKVLTKEELVQKYDTLFPVDIKSFSGLLEFLKIEEDELGTECLPEDYMLVPDINRELRRHSTTRKPKQGALRILLLDLTQHFSGDSDLQYDAFDPPLGLMSLLTYLNREYGEKIDGKVLKSRIDFDGYDRLKAVLKQFKPGAIGIRTLTMYRDFFHRTVSLIRQWGFDVPVIVGGPHATGSYKAVLQDRNIDLVVLGEGEVTFARLIGAILENNGKLPQEDVLKEIDGLAFIPGSQGKQLSREILLSDHLEEAMAGQSADNPEPVNQPGDLVYTMYTSGSTGKPKGVLVEHRNVVAYVFAFLREFDIGAQDIVLQQASYSFDAFSEEVYPVLSKGGRLAIPANETVMDFYELRDYIDKHNITIVDCSPLLLNQLNQQADSRPFPSVRIFISGADVLKRDYIHNLLETALVYNTYGPTEATVCAAYYRCGDAGVSNDIPIGAPIANYKVYILDKTGALQPVGVPGELTITGPGITRGYLNNPELTGEKFTSSPRHLVTSSLLYITGDLARWLADGNLQFLGRIDRQVKIRGFRIETAEIETHLLNHPLVKEALVTVRETAEDERALCAYFVLHPPGTVPDPQPLRVRSPGKRLRHHLSLFLPTYMIPSYFVKIERMPLTPRGKIDMDALPVPGIEAGDEYAAPGNEVEERLVEIWSGVLDVEQEQIGINTNFFELGGHSLKATILVARVRQAFDIRLPLSKVFTHPTVKTMGRFVAEATKDTYKRIPLVESREYYPQSSAQKRLFFLDHLENIATSYNMPLAFRVVGNLDRNRLRETFEHLIRRHESLRTSFHLLGNEAVQKVHDKVEFDIEEYNAGVGEEAGMIRRFIRPFDLSRVPLLRAALVSLSADDHLLLFDMHHIIGDGMSDAVLAKDFIRLYAGEELPPLTIQYKEFSSWQNRLIREGKIKSQEQHWQTLFPEAQAGELPQLNLPYDYPMPGVFDFAGDSFEFTLDREHTSRVKQLALEHGATLYMTLLAAFYLLLYKYTGQGDIIVGGVIAGRQHADLQQVIGMFVNTLPLRSQPRGDKSFSVFLEEVKSNCIKALENQDVQLETLVERLGIQRDPARNPLFDVCFALQNFERSEPVIENIEGVAFSLYPFEYKLSLFDLGVDVLERDETIEFTFEYRTSLFRAETIRRMAGHFETIIKKTAASAGILLSGLEMISEDEKKQVLMEFNDTAADYPRDKIVPRLFEEQVEKTPHRIALTGMVYTAVGVIHESPLHSAAMHLSYLELNRRADRLANLLYRQGVRPNTIVALVLERSLEMFIAILAVFKTGGAYLPIDPDYPQERIDYMLKDSGTKILLAVGASSKLALNRETENCRLSIVNCELTMNETPGHLHLPPAPAPSLAYVIYTSGSTGRPKGVMVEQRNLLAYICAFWLQCEITSADIMLQQASFTFDTFLEEVFPVLLRGGRLAVPRKEKILDIDLLARFIDRQSITIIDCSPLLLNELNRRFKSFTSVHTYISGGDVLKKEYVGHFLQDGIVLNGYGPTETTVCVAFYKLTGEEAGDIPLGRPIANYSIYILDRDGNLLPVGIPGELCAAGPGVSRGYLNNPELTAEKFVIRKQSLVNSHLSLGSRLTMTNNFTNDQCPMTNDRLYRTGDLARWLSDGNVQYLGRIDQQVKIRGFRIELEEIEQRLLQHSGVKEAVVVTGKDNSGDNSGDRNLCAYFVTRAEHKYNNPTVMADDLSDFLVQSLPAYMIPAYFIPVERIPRTFSGKVDRSALPQPGTGAAGELYIAPGNEIENRLAEIWAEVLEIPRTPVSTNADFFRMGGHSLKAAVLVSRIRKSFNVEFPLSQVFAAPTIKEFARFIRSAEPRLFEDIEAVEKREYYPQSSAQKRLFFLDAYENIGTTYNMPLAFAVKGAVDRVRFQQAAEALIRRHESLRTSFRTVANEPVQVVHDTVDFRVEYVDFTVGEEPARMQIETRAEAFVRPFDLARAPLLRAALLSFGQEEHVLLFDMHHIVGDGTSDGIMVGDFTRLYAGEQLPPVKIQYKDFSCWQNRLFRCGAIREQEAYWHELFRGGDAGDIPKLDMQGDFPRPAIFSFEGANLEFVLEAQDTLQLQHMALEKGVTLYMCILALFNVLMFKYTGREDIVVGGVIAGRRHAALQDIIGMFVNTLALRNYPTGEKTFAEFLQEVKHNCLKAFENQDVQFEQLVDDLNLDRDPSHNPLFDVTCVMQNFQRTAAGSRVKGNAAGLTFTPYEFENRSALFDLSLDAFEEEEGLFFNLEYCTGLFKHETIIRLKNHFIHLTRQICRDPSIHLSAVDIVGEEERRLLVRDFNRAQVEYPRDKTLLRLFEEQVERTPDRTAAVCGCDNLTYRTLDEYANRLGNWLSREVNVRPDHLVGLLMNKSIHLLPAILGILKSGAAYVPIEASLPQERVKTVIDDARIGVIVSQAKYMRLLDRLQWECGSFHTYVCLDSTALFAADRPGDDWRCEEALWQYVDEIANDDITAGGWFSSFTGHPFSKTEMEEYGGNVLEKLTPLLHKKMRVLEIGCSSGFTMYRIAPKVGFYLGTDLSEGIIRENKKRVQREGFDNISLITLPAHEIHALEADPFDLVILNSVVQSFHSQGYLRSVMFKIPGLLKDRGYIFVGDIMDHGKKERFMRELKEFKRKNRDKNYRTKTDFSEDLFVHRDFFLDLVVDMPVPCTVDFSDKIFTLENELTRFRYDALLTLDKNDRKGDRPKKGDRPVKRKYQYDAAAVLRSPGTAPPHAPHPSNLMYVIYTSGSGGQPRGVLVEHGNAAAYVYAFYDICAITAQDTMLQHASHAFDTFTEEVYPVLLRGGKLAIAKGDERIDAGLLSQFIARHQVNIVDCSPQLLNELNKDPRLLASVHTYLSGGDTLKIEHVSNLLKTAVVLNGYGPTETTVCITFHRCCGDEPSAVPIGKPIANYTVYILDKNGHLAPVGVPGELCTAGPGVTRGYLNNPELTADKFVISQFPYFNSGPNDQCPMTNDSLFRTGDLCRWLADGSIDFLGRIDQQVKIRGFRIEWGEIEHQLLSHDRLEAAAVLDMTDMTGDKYLCAYVVPAYERAFDSSKAMVRELKNWLSRLLPEYMVPAYIIAIDKIPLTPNGKINKRALPSPLAKHSVNEPARPSSDIEIKLAELWRGVLGIEGEAINIDDSFFDLGGHSLKATVMKSEVQSKFNVGLSLGQVFQSPTIRQLAGYIEEAGEEADLISDDRLVHLKMGNSLHHLFLVHDGTGQVEGYVEFCNQFKGDIDCWGIRAFGFFSYAPLNLTIEAVAADYIETIKKVQPKGPYYLAGWSFGGTIAFEMFRQLEARQEEVRFLALIDSSPPHGGAWNNNAGVGEFSVRSELQWLDRLPGLDRVKGKIGQLKALDLFWQKLVNVMEKEIPDIDVETVKNLIPEDIRLGIPNFQQLEFTELVFHMNLSRSFDRAANLYVPEGKVKNEVIYFEASKGDGPGANEWQEFCAGGLKLYKVYGDHFSIFRPPDVTMFAATFEKALKRVL